MKEQDILKELALRVAQENPEKIWSRIQKHYKSIGHESYLDNLEWLHGFAQALNKNQDYGIIIQDFKYDDTSNLAKIPLLVHSSTYKNEGDTVINEEFSFEKSLEQSFTLKFTEGLKVGIKATLKIKIPMTAELDTELSSEITFDESQEITKKKTKTWSLKSTVPVPPHSEVKSSGYITNAKTDTNFSASAVVTKGTLVVWLAIKTGHVTEMDIPIVVLLPEERRQFSLKGKFKGTEGIAVYHEVEKSPL